MKGNPPTDRAAPLKCAHCDRTMSTPLVCDYCHAVQPAAVSADHFALLGIPRRFDVDPDELRRRYVTLNRHAHPDYHTAEQPEVQQLHLQVSANLNDAYRTLRDPAARASYLLGLLGGKSSAEDKSVPDGFLGTMMMLQEEVADAQAAGDDGELERIGKLLRTQRDGLMNRIRTLFADLDEGVACEAVRNDLLAEIRQQLNAVSYVRKLLSQLP